MFAAAGRRTRHGERAGREEENEQISRNISDVAQELPPRSAKDLLDLVDSESNST